ncbi:MAG: hypothetical protein ACRC62_25410 [Microcoleus sp.]
MSYGQVLSNSTPSLNNELQKSDRRYNRIIPNTRIKSGRWVEK